MSLRARCPATHSPSPCGTGKSPRRGAPKPPSPSFPCGIPWKLAKEDILFFIDNHKPGRGKSLAPWHVPLLAKRSAMPPPPVNELPPVPEIALPDDSCPLAEEDIHLDTPDTLFPPEVAPAASSNPQPTIFKGKRTVQ